MDISFFMPPGEQKDISDFLDYLKFQKRYSPHTVISYQNDLTSFFDFLQLQFGSTALAGIKPAFVRSWLAGLKQDGMVKVLKGQTTLDEIIRVTTE